MTDTSYRLFDTAINSAIALDATAAAAGVESIGPLYGLCIPMKGTASVKDFPSGSGVGVLSGYTPVEDSELTKLIKQRNGVRNLSLCLCLLAIQCRFPSIFSNKHCRSLHVGVDVLTNFGRAQVIFGTTNVPEFAAGWITANPASGHTRNPYNHRFTVGGSSGGSASAVASYICPLAVTEDTGGSTRVPASSNQNFGFDPSRNHYQVRYDCDFADSTSFSSPAYHLLSMGS